MAEEISEHLARLTDAGLAAGLSPKEARLAALKQFGGVEQIKETARDQRGVAAVEHIVADFGYGLRQLRKAPGFAVIAILTVAIGIGATTAIFSVVNAVVLRPLAYPYPGQLVTLAAAGPPDFLLRRVTPAVYFELRRSARRFQSFTAWENSFANVTGLAYAQRRLVRSVTPNYLAMHGVSPLLGRGFQPGDTAPGAHGVAILGYEFWLTQFGAQAGAVGRTLEVNGQPCTVIGVMPRGFPIGSAVDRRQRELAERIQKHQRFHEAVPTPDEGEDRKRRQCRPGGGQNHVPEDSPPSAPFHARGFLQFHRDVAEKLAQQEHAERARRRRENQRQRRVDEPPLQDPVHRHQHCLLILRHKAVTKPKRDLPPALPAAHTPPTRPGPALRHNSAKNSCGVS
ncbi:MAG: ABC transporter permease [Verrucomicrobia bacterium]|nr:ABC transporter permease [Verrucomicrobiota bacterium]